MQIKKVVLYSNTGEIRTIDFNIGKVNIVTGESMSGKSALGHIIEYCLCSHKCNIPEGVIRDTVSWFAVLLQFHDCQIFIARRNPGSKRQINSDYFYRIEKEVDIPRFNELQKNVEMDYIEQLLNSRLGISEYTTEVPKGQTRHAVDVSIRNAVTYCFQHQSEIASYEFLFHRQAEPYLFQNIKDTMPYYLGAISEQSLELRQELRKLEHSLRDLNKDYYLKKQFNETVDKEAFSLLREAYTLGLLNDYGNNEKKTTQDIFYLFRTIDFNVVNDNARIPFFDEENIEPLQKELKNKKCELQNLDYSISEAKGILLEYKKYQQEISHQKNRLQSIGLYKYLDFRPMHCPFCSSVMSGPNKQAEAIKEAIDSLAKALSDSEKEQPRLVKYISQLELKRIEIIQVINKIESFIEAEYRQIKIAKHLKENILRKGELIGRINNWLERTEQKDDIKEIEKKIHVLENKIDNINKKLSVELIEDKKQSSLSRIQYMMTEWAKELNLEYSGEPYRLDFNKLTVVADRERPVPLSQMGSGANWVGAHLITYFAFQKFFIEEKRPVPSFIFLDQPSQVYFDSDTREYRKRSDKENVIDMYNFMQRRVEEMNGDLQIIVVDHAEDLDENFRQSTIEHWGTDKRKLIPFDWYN